MPSVKEYEQYIRQQEDVMEQQQDQNRQLVKGQTSMFESISDDNLIRWQLDLKEDLDKIYHLLRGDQVKMDKKGNVFYEEPEDTNLKPFNEFGVQLIINVMSFYLNRNTILSNYTEAMINWKVLDFGNELSDMMFNRYEEMGMDTPEKIKMYPMINRELVDSVHSAYLRARNGGERNSLRTARTVTQSEPIGSRLPIPGTQPPKRFSPFKPSTWRDK